MNNSNINSEMYCMIYPGYGDVHAIVPELRQEIEENRMNHASLIVDSGGMVLLHPYWINCESDIPNSILFGEFIGAELNFIERSKIRFGNRIQLLYSDNENQVSGENVQKTKLQLGLEGKSVERMVVSAEILGSPLVSELLKRIQGSFDVQSLIVDQSSSLKAGQLPQKDCNREKVSKQDFRKLLFR